MIGPLERFECLAGGPRPGDRSHGACSFKIRRLLPALHAAEPQSCSTRAPLTEPLAVILRTLAAAKHTEGGLSPRDLRGPH